MLKKLALQVLESHRNTEEDMFEQAHEDWKDYRGFESSERGSGQVPSIGVEIKK